MKKILLLFNLINILSATNYGMSETNNNREAAIGQARSIMINNMNITLIHLPKIAGIENFNADSFSDYVSTVLENVNNDESSLNQFNKNQYDKERLVIQDKNIFRHYIVNNKISIAPGYLTSRTEDPANHLQYSLVQLLALIFNMISKVAIIKQNEISNRFVLYFNTMQRNDLELRENVNSSIDKSLLKELTTGYKDEESLYNSFCTKSPEIVFTVCLKGFLWAIRRNRWNLNVSTIQKKSVYELIISSALIDQLLRSIENYFKLLIKAYCEDNRLSKEIEENAYNRLSLIMERRRNALAEEIKLYVINPQSAKKK